MPAKLDDELKNQQSAQLCNRVRTKADEPNFCRYFRANATIKIFHSNAVVTIFLEVFLLNAAVKVFLHLCSGENNSAGISALMPQLNKFFTVKLFLCKCHAYETF